MKSQQFAMIMIAAISLLLAGCGQPENPDIAVIVALTQTAAAQGEEAAPAASQAAEDTRTAGVISGIVQGQAPPTPPMVVYAVDATNGAWFSLETPLSDVPVPYTLQVPPGQYRVFAFSDMGAGFGYPSQNGWDLAVITVAEGQTVSDVLVSPPSQCECGSMFGLPASPDGRYAAIPGPAEECKASVIATLSAAQNDNARAAAGAFDPAAQTQGAYQRVQFAAGASSARIESVAQPDVCSLFLLGAQQGQQMDVKLAPWGSVSLGVWGVDGSVLLSTAAGENEFHDILPFTQDYTIEVCTRVNAAISYTLDIYIAPLSEPMSASSYIVHPVTEPFSSAEMQTLMSSGVPQLLPPYFPHATGEEPVVPYLLSLGSLEFDASLDYGSSCHGTGACHYGIYSGRYIGSDVGPFSTPHILYDASLAQQVSLDRGITGYFIPSACGANCSDAMMFFIYDEYQYVLGIRAASQEQMVALVNDAIDNSIP